MTMGGYSDSLSANMENSRNSLRRIARHDETEFSKDSILNAMEKFVKTVNAMDDTVLVPCRLMDLKLSDGEEKSAASGRRRDPLASEDLFALFNMLNAAKMELLWGRDLGEERKESPPTKKGHVRRPSTASTASTSSGTSLPSDTESEAGVEGSEDSGVEAEECEDVGARTATDFKRHLMGLRRALAGLTEAASSLTQRYQADVGAPV